MTAAFEKMNDMELNQVNGGNMVALYNGENKVLSSIIHRYPPFLGEDFCKNENDTDNL